jgi:hypothetical protein
MACNVSVSEDDKGDDSTYVRSCVIRRILNSGTH